MNPLLLLGLGVLAWKYFGNTSKQNKYYSGLRVQIQGVDLAGGKTIKVKLNFQNANSKPVTIRSMFGEVWINGNKIGLLDYKIPIVIKDNNETTVTVDVNLKIVNTITALTQGIANSTLAITGNMNIDNKQQPLPPLQYRIT
jgi:LEA14-like dessication related protein